VTERLDPYGTWGDWDLRQFKVELARWRDITHPPPDIYELVDQWWPRLAQPAERTRAVAVSEEYDPKRNLWWLWVPGAEWIDEPVGGYRVQCWFRVYEQLRPPQLVCDAFRSRQAMTPSEVDRADGMG
jgi:hypothetical protein